MASTDRVDFESGPFNHLGTPPETENRSPDLQAVIRVWASRPRLHAGADSSSALPTASEHAALPSRSAAAASSRWAIAPSPPQDGPRLHIASGRLYKRYLIFFALSMPRLEVPWAFRYNMEQQLIL